MKSYSLALSLGSLRAFCVPFVTRQPPPPSTQAEMSVHQTRAHFLRAGPIVDNPAVGAALAAAYWKPGNSGKFLDLVAGLTGAPLTGQAWIAELEKDVAAKIASEQAEYTAAIARVEAAAAAAAARTDDVSKDVDLNMRVLVKDGDELIADSEGTSFLELCATFEKYVAKRFPRFPPCEDSH
jgi:hypothetical protein